MKNYSPKKTFQELGLKGENKLMPGSFFLTIGHLSIYRHNMAVSSRFLFDCKALDFLLKGCTILTSSFRVEYLKLR